MSLLVGWTRRAMLVVALTTVVVAPAEARSHTIGNVVPAIVSRALPAVVSITTRQNEQDQFGVPVAVIIRRDGDTLTLRPVPEEYR